MPNGQITFIAMFGGGGLLFVLVGVVVRLVAVGALRAAARATAPATGRVVEYQTVVPTDPDSGECTHYDPVIEYQDVGGVSHRAVVYGASMMMFAVGQQVAVRYDPSCFEHARIVGFDPDLYDTLGLSIGFVGMGGIGVLIGVYAWVARIQVTMN